MSELKRWPKENGITQMDVSGYWVDEAALDAIPLVMLTPQAADKRMADLRAAEAWLEQSRPRASSSCATAAE